MNDEDIQLNMSGDSVDSELERADTIVSSSQNSVESL